MAVSKNHRALGMGLAILVPSLAVAALELPHVFQAGDTIVASEVNENFQALADKIDELRQTDAGQWAMELQVSGTAEPGQAFSLAHSPRSTGDWPTVIEGTRQAVPSPGLYLVTLEVGATSSLAGNPLNHSLRVQFGEEHFALHAKRWSAETTELIDHRNQAFVRITTPETQAISLQPAAGTTAMSGGSRMLIRRLGD